MELDTVKEILAEVFRVRVSEVDEMILSRFEEALFRKLSLKKIGYGRRSSGWRNEFDFSEIKATISEPKSNSISSDSSPARFLQACFLSMIFSKHALFRLHSPRPNGRYRDLWP